MLSPPRLLTPRIIPYLTSYWGVDSTSLASNEFLMTSTSSACSTAGIYSIIHVRTFEKDTTVRRLSPA